ncbi:DsbA family oxidoreductase [Nocardiopsis sp. CNT-189]|uniref:DsbA family oxidoreductase n=1 Tax=Nocardiopsis oceanisediminis TaxID=2816862 RepID=UPI003B34EC8D
MSDMSGTGTGGAAAVSVEVWTDLVCPWCYIGKRRLERAIRLTGLGERVRVRWRSSELDPHGGPGGDLTLPDYMRRQGLSAAEIALRLSSVGAQAEEEGLAYRLDRARPVNTLDAHRLVHFAEERGIGGAVQERLMRAYACEGAVLSDRSALVGLAAEAGLEAGAAAELLESGRHTGTVRADEARAASLGLHGVPSFLFGGEHAASGARSAEELDAHLRRAAGASAPPSGGAAPHGSARPVGGGRPGDPGDGACAASPAAAEPASEGTSAP